MFILFRIACLVLIVLQSHGKRFVIPAEQYQESHLRLLNGRDKWPDEYAFVILLVEELKPLRICTGAMITEDWGISAAHCTAHGTRMRAWFKNFTVPPILLNTAAEVLETFAHPAYRVIGAPYVIGVANDISLFHSSRVNVRSFAKLSSVDRSTLIGLPVTIVGGGMTMLYDASISMIKLMEENFKELQVGEGVIVKCNQHMQFLSKYVICVTPKCNSKNQKIYHGDSGGPLIHDNKVVGICSYAIVKDIGELSAGFTPISPYLDWINLVMNTKGKY